MNTLFLPSQKCLRSQLLVELIAMCILFAAAMSVFGTSGVGLACGLGVAYVVPRWLYARLSGGETRGGIVLMVAGLLLVVWAFRNIYGWTLAEGHSFADPVLRCDDKGYYLWALHYYDGSVPEPDTKFVGYPLMILMSWKLLGHSIVWPIAINVMLTLLTVVLTGQTAGRALAGRVQADRGTITFLAMLVTSLLGFFMSHAAMMLKEPLTYFAVALAAYAIARMKEMDEDSRGSVWHDIALFTIAVALMSIARTSVIYFLVAGVIITFFDNKDMWRYACTLLGIALIGMGMGIYWSNGFSMEVQMRILATTDTGGDIMKTIYQARGIYGEMMSDYFFLPVWQKLLLLPVTCTLQLFIPFPWVDNEVLDVWSVATRFQLVWYAVAGVSLYYLFVLAWKKINLGWWAMWPFVCAAAVAFTTSGTVSRYILPYEPLFATIAVWVLLKYHEATTPNEDDKQQKGTTHHKDNIRRSFNLWCAAYAVTVTITLIICYLTTP